MIMLICVLIGIFSFYAIFLLCWIYMLNGQIRDSIASLAKQIHSLDKQQMHFSHMLKKQNDQIIKQLTKKQLS